jgi:DNA-binding XRE family transcriptional regulator
MPSRTICAAAYWLPVLECGDLSTKLDNDQPTLILIPVVAILYLAIYNILRIVPSIRDGKQTGVFTLPRKVSLSQHLRNGRLARRLSVADVASQVGVTAPCVYFWEIGRTRPRAENLKALCKVLKLPVRATREIAAA